MQPFVAVGLKLKEYGHRVRVATHSPLRGFVEQFGLEFYPLGGDPEVLAEFAVQSKGALQVSAHSLLPSMFTSKHCTWCLSIICCWSALEFTLKQHVNPSQVSFPEGSVR